MSKPVDPASIALVGTEHAHQVALFAWAALNFSKYPDLKLMFAIPVGGLRNKITAANLKAEGAKAGVPDIFLPAPRQLYHGLFIELKVGKNKASDLQNEWVVALRKLGYGAVVCTGWEAAREIILSYLNWS
jgi:hypothetical protein